MFYCVYDCDECGMFHEEHEYTHDSRGEAREHGEHAKQYHGGGCCPPDAVRVKIERRAF